MPNRRKKLRAKISRNPKNVRFEDLEKLLLSYGFTARTPASGSSHHFFQLKTKVGTLVQFTIPYRRPHLKPAYVRMALSALDMYLPETDDEQEKESDIDD
jgi:hypothetical protein